MAATDDGTFAGSIAETYDRYLVPLIFDSYALDLASRLTEANPWRCWRRPQEPEFLHERSHPAFLRMRG